MGQSRDAARGADGPCDPDPQGTESQGAEPRGAEPQGTEPREVQGVGRRRRPRRATLPAPEGSDPEPYDPPLDTRSESENDDRLRGDRPPHWG